MLILVVNRGVSIKTSGTLIGGNIVHFGGTYDIKTSGTFIGGNIVHFGGT